ncbi:L-serine ammonia-lyase, iron-sulfur-dependent, subunit beta [Bacillus cereus]|nr:L-serine ammonia-lyase, iron-sulfur-dependent, subunit beta [Bacillus cereus]
MKYKSMFDIIGPIMVGPSSSHTAGAARIGVEARTLFGEQPDEVDISFYGSFAKTYKGHGTDVAIVGGLMGFPTDDARIPKALNLAKIMGMNVNFHECEEESEHPNTARLRLIKGSRQMELVGISIGGGMMEITEIDGKRVS